MVMDDFGALIWRFGKRLVVTHDDDHASTAHGQPHAASPDKPAAAAE
jgi:hypothetical protein